MQATQIGMTPVAAWSLDTNIAPLQAPVWSPVKTGATDINYLRTPDQSLTLGHNSGPDISLDSIVSWAFTSAHSSSPLLLWIHPSSPVYKPFHLTLSSASSPCTLSAQWCPTARYQGSWLSTPSLVIRDGMDWCFFSGRRFYRAVKHILHQGREWGGGCWTHTIGSYGRIGVFSQ